MSDTLMTDPATQPPEGQPPADQTGQPAAGAEGQPPSAGEPASQGPAAEGDQPADGQQQQQAKPEGAPEKYEFTPPEGVQFDASVIAQFSEVARELNLPQDAAQKVLDKMAPTIQARQAEQLAALREDWATSARADKEFGGDKLTESLGAAKKALDQFGSPEFKTLLNDSGLGNHPEVIRFMVRAGKAISEDRFVSGAQGASGRSDDPAKRLFPDHA